MFLPVTLIARIYEVFPLLCPMCGGQMRLIAFITEGTQIRKILDHIGVDLEPPHISPARGPPLWDDCSDAQTDEGVHIEPDWDLAAQPAPTHPSQRYGFCLRRFFHGEPATRAGNPGFARGSKPVAEVYTAARVVVWLIRLTGAHRRVGQVV